MAERLQINLGRQTGARHVAARGKLGREESIHAIYFRSLTMHLCITDLRHASMIVKC